MLISLPIVIISQCISNHHDVHLKYIHFFKKLNERKQGKYLQTKEKK